MKKISISVLGDGGWGTTLAVLLSRKGFKVTLWSAFSDYSAQLNKTRINRKFLPGIKIPKDIEITSDLSSAVAGRSLVVLAIPSQYLRLTLRRIKKLNFPRKAIYLSTVKGIENKTIRRMSEVICDELGKVRLAVLSGPTIAQETVKEIPTAAVIASSSKRTRKLLQDIFTTGRFRVYTNSDVIGVELGGSLKNIIAIACGISDGLGFGANTKAAILSRGLVEISRLGVSMGAKKSTLNGISGLGDLVTTCISPYSRNRFVGEQIGRGKKLKDIQQNMQMVAEGVPTTRSAYAMSLKYKTDMPITREVYKVLFKNKPPLQAVNDLMSREKKEE